MALLFMASRRNCTSAWPLMNTICTAGNSLRSFLARVMPSIWGVTTSVTTSSTGCSRI